MSYIAGYTVSRVVTLNLTVEEAVTKSKKSSSLLVHMLGMMEPQQINTNETVKDVYKECLELKDFLSENLWLVNEDEFVACVQTSLDDLMHALSKYDKMNDMMKDMIEGEWEFVDASAYISAC